MSAISVQPLERCGANVDGVDLSRLSIAEFDQIQAAFAEHGLLFFRDQALTERQHIAFARRWGEIDVNQYFSAHLDHPEIAVVLQEPDDDFNIGAAWHADHSYDPEPALGSVLVARQVPTAGGDTLFASMYAAYEALDTPTKHRIDTLRAVHSARHVFGAVDAPCDVAHPMVIAHPLSGKKALYVNPTFTTGIDGLDHDEATMLLHALYDHATNDDFVERFTWAPGSIAFWDSRAVWHHALNDYPGQRRLMHRVTIEGCTLAPPIEHQRADPTFVQRAGATLAGGLITAAMDGIGIVIEPHRTRRADIEIVGEAPDDLPDGLPGKGLAFGDLPPI